MDSGCTRMSPMTLWFCGSVPLLNIQNSNTPALFGRILNFHDGVVLTFPSYKFKFEQSVKFTVILAFFCEDRRCELNLLNTRTGISFPLPNLL